MYTTDLYENLYSIKTEIAKCNLNGLILDCITTIYVVFNKTFSEEEFIDLRDNLKKNVDYNVMNIEIVNILSALLASKYEYPFSKVTRLVDINNILLREGFNSRISSFMAFSIIDEEDYEKIINRAKNIYQDMQDRHSIYTGEDDYLYAIYLASMKKEISEIIMQKEYYYEALLNSEYVYGKKFQLLAHQLTLINKFEEKELMMRRINKIFSILSNKKLKRYYLSMIVAIAWYGHDILAFLNKTKHIFDGFNTGHAYKEQIPLMLSIIIFEQIKSEKKMNQLSYDENQFVTSSILNMIVELLKKNRLI